METKMFCVRCCENVDDFLVGDYGDIATFSNLRKALDFLIGCPKNIKGIVEGTAESISEFWRNSDCDTDSIAEFGPGGLHVELYGHNAKDGEMELILGHWYAYDPVSKSLITMNFGDPDLKDDSFLTEAEVNLIEEYIRYCNP